MLLIRRLTSIIQKSQLRRTGPFIIPQSRKYNMPVYMQVLGCDGFCEGAVLLFFDEKRFLFNVPEGTQRYCTECKIKIQKMSGIFLNSLEPESILGLPGMLLTLRETERSRNSEDGLRSITKIISARGEVPLAVKEGAPITISGPTGTSSLLESMTPFLKVPGFYTVTEPSTSPEQYEVYSSISPFFTINAISTTHSDDTKGYQRLHYSIDMPEQPGKFMAEKAQALGVIGRKRAFLKSGESVESDKIPGRVVHPHEVLGKSSPPVSVFVMSIVAGSEDAVLPILIKWTQSKLSSGVVIRGIYHLGGPTVDYNKIKEQFLKIGIPTTTHIHPIHEQTHTVFHSSALHHDRLSCMAPELFSRESFRVAMRLPELHLLPIIGNDIAMPDHQGLNREFSIEKERESWPDELKKLALESHSTPEQLGYPKVSMLGTGGMMPSKYRNVTSQLIELSPVESILLDSGEGTLGQLRRIRDVDKILSTLQIIFLSHIHADHHVGVASLLHRRALLVPNNPILVIGPKDLAAFLECYSRYVNLSFCFQPCSNFQDVEESHKLLQLSNIKFQTIPVDHCSDSWGCVVEVQRESKWWKICFSGDTRPCQALVRAGKDCHLLIHEATFEDDKIEDAICKKHSCVSEALQSATDMSATETLLTHFSQRYPKVPPPMSTENLKAGLAFDLMTVSLPNSSPLETLNQRLSILTDYFASVDDAKKEQSKIKQAKTQEEKRRRQDMRVKKHVDVKRQKSG